MIKKWITIEIKTDDLSKDAVSNFLVEIGSAGNEILADSIRGYFHEKEWDEVKRKNLITYIKNLKELGYETNVSSIRIKEHDERDWVREWKKYYKKVEVSEKISVVPPWIQGPNGSTVIIEPGMAFGTGTHETTRLVLRMLDNYIRENDVVCDIGTGSGVLAIASMKLGAKEVVAVDISEDAINDAENNIGLNNLSGKISLIHGGIEQIQGRIFNLLLANINFNILIENEIYLKESIKRDGYILISGILDFEKDEFNSCFEDDVFKLVESQVEGEWLGLVYRRYI